MKLLIDMDARGNELSSCKIPDLKKQKSYWIFRTLDTLAEKRKENNSNNTIELLSQLQKEKEIANTIELLSQL